MAKSPLCSQTHGKSNCPLPLENKISFFVGFSRRIEKPKVKRILKGISKTNENDYSPISLLLG